MTNKKDGKRPPKVSCCTFALPAFMWPTFGCIGQCSCEDGGCVFLARQDEVVSATAPPFQAFLMQEARMTSWRRIAGVQVRVSKLFETRNFFSGFCPLLSLHSRLDGFNKSAKGYVFGLWSSGCTWPTWRFARPNQTCWLKLYRSVMQVHVQQLPEGAKKEIRNP